MKKKSIILVGGGTGGHAAPVLAVYEKLKELDPKLQISVIGVGSPEEREFFKNIPSYLVIKSGKLNRFFTIRNIAEAFNLIIGFIQSMIIIRKIKPSLIFSKGGYSSFPIVKVSSLFGIPYFQHESDIEMGKVNRLMASKAEKVFTCYPAPYYKSIKNDKIVFSGPVLCDKFIEDSSDCKLFGFDNSKPIIFITGGSQGSLNLSKNVLPVARELLGNYNIIHQAGKHSIQIVQDFQNKLSDEEKKCYYITDFLRTDNGKDMMAAAVNCSSLIITRGGSTIIELAVKGKAMIIVPWKYSASDHQNKNADFFEKNKAAAIIREDILTPEIIKSTIENLFEGNTMQEYGQRAKALFPSNGTEIIAQSIIEEIEK